MREGSEEATAPAVVDMILTVRGQKVILDQDLAALYGVETGALNRAVKRNRHRFPTDFCFRLTSKEDRALRCQSGASKGRGGRRYLPHAFTEHGAIMAANVLNSKQAIEMSVFIVRAFIKMREHLLDRAELVGRLAEIEKALLSHDSALRDLYQKIRPLLLPQPDLPRKQIGFGVGGNPSGGGAGRKRPKAKRGDDDGG